MLLSPFGAPYGGAPAPGPGGPMQFPSMAPRFPMPGGGGGGGAGPGPMAPSMPSMQPPPQPSNAATMTGLASALKPAAPNPYGSNPPGAGGAPGAGGSDLASTFAKFKDMPWFQNLMGKLGLGGQIGTPPNPSAGGGYNPIMGGGFNPYGAGTAAAAGGYMPTPQGMFPGNDMLLGGGGTGG